MIILLACSCGQNSFEKKLNGKWYELENEHATWEFYSDSLIVGTKDKEKYKWQASDSKIKFHYITYIWDSVGKKIDYENKIVIDYKIDSNNDSLFGTLKNKHGNYKFSLIKAENYIEYLNKKFGIEFSLPKKNSAESIDTDAIYGMKIFMGISNNEIIGKTELSENLYNLESNIEIFKDSIKPYSRHQINTNEALLDSRFHLRVFADKNIPDSTITKYLKVTIARKNTEMDKHTPERFRGIKRDNLPIRIFRIYNNKEEINPWNIKGVEIKTIANNVYN